MVQAKDSTRYATSNYIRAMPKFQVFIDEAGDPGVKPKDDDERHWTDWFTVSAVVVSNSRKLDIIDWVKDMNEAVRNVNANALHYRNLSAPNQARVCRMLGRKPLRLFVVASHKDSMRDHYNPKLGRANDKEFYNWCLRLLLERVTEWCYRRGRKDEDKDCSAEVIFSRRGGHKYPELRTYLKKLEAQTLTQTLVLNAKGIAPGVLSHDRLRVEQDSEIAGLQLADITASSVFNAVNTLASRHDLEPARSLKPRLTNAHRSRFPAGAGLLMLPFKHQGMIPADDQPFFEECGYRF
ncbi:hypothetical protein A0J57_18205 [Sphingobium sp. 22B]|uniref:DUF3800 domain-containing protein n=1 Tax=unclassified Sphingobium TaxID=2611147 RepID=UPI0007846165|nr:MULTISPECIES: DUF3800 domain-containing protein [unclassified Sphingobium]KXU29223.1 hypothetical protein AXW74_24225 [Sphingobium sp. AM]KYC30925.1 hypothetical protein A0J57_18205 [Sphingobium sp. 22B]OAP30457.1 hypothetical protein A8O16_18495 [Sphingobium sp. 20006FA]